MSWVPIWKLCQLVFRMYLHATVSCWWLFLVFAQKLFLKKGDKVFCWFLPGLEFDKELTVFFTVELVLEVFLLKNKVSGHCWCSWKTNYQEKNIQTGGEKCWWTWKERHTHTHTHTHTHLEREGQWERERKKSERESEGGGCVLTCVQQEATGSGTKLNFRTQDMKSLK